MEENDKARRFTGRASSYAKGRPDYPDAVLNFLFSEGILWKGAKVADLGSGTGIFSRQLLERSIEVFGVEPNEDMRREAGEQLRSYAGFHSISGRAEQTNLPSRSVDAVTAAQSFHWFDPEPSRKEISRIIQPWGFAVIVWNNRKNGTKFNDEYSSIIHEYGTNYQEIMKLKDADRFFGPNNFEKKVFIHSRDYDLKSILDLVTSVSYLPREGDARREEMVSEIERLFLERQRGGKVRMEYETICCFGKLK